ncbi:MAG: hypothetical protein M0026_09890 [Nocardiopsaceae bacterium]|nr:hypothetical protein [Nocardiopsaceae bacterium]
MLADVVVPITYRIGYTRQAAHDLRAYKATPSSAEARLRLTCLFWHFCVRHLACVKRRLGIDHFTHVAFVPSTKSPMVTHPLQAMLKPMVPLDLVELVLNNSIDPYSRNLNLDWFKTDPIRSISARPSAVLLIDDTWVTGARVQSAAYCLKEAGAARVATIVLARQINPDYGHAAPLVNKATGIRYDPEICVLHAPAAS